jgi:hypothetical protein
MGKKPAHRGRFQAQGGGVEESIAWAQDVAPTVGEGLQMLNQLADKLAPTERRKRSEAFDKARAYVKRAGEHGGVDAVDRKSWPRGSDIRVDLEVLIGRAFVPDPDKST